MGHAAAYAVYPAPMFMSDTFSEVIQENPLRVAEEIWAETTAVLKLKKAKQISARGVGFMRMSGAIQDSTRSRPVQFTGLGVGWGRHVFSLRISDLIQ